MRMRSFTACLLLLWLTSCTLLQRPIVQEYRAKTIRAKTTILKDVPESDMPCLKPENFKESELDIREAITYQVAKAFSAEKFGDLEEYHKRYQQSKALTPSGRWKLQFFYNSLFDRDLADHSKSEEDPEKWSKVEAKILDWIKAYPESPTPYIAYSEFLIEYAWHLRGGDFAEDTPLKKLQLFNKKIQMVRSILERSEAIANSDPQWYANMLKVAMAQSWNKSDVGKLLSEALSKEPYYQETYHAAFSYLLPKWSGSFEEAEQFANDAVTITQKCEGKSMYARIYWRAFNLEAEFYVSPLDLKKGSWQKMSASFNDLIRIYPTSWNINNYAKFACLAGDRIKTRELLAMIGNQVDQQAWEDSQIDFYDCQRIAIMDQRSH